MRPWPNAHSAIVLSGTPARGCTPASSNAGKSSSAAQSTNVARLTSRNGPRTSGLELEQVIADDGQERAARQPAGDECRQPGDGERGHDREQNRVQAHGPFEEGWCHAMQDNRCAGARKMAVASDAHCCLAVKGCFVIGSIGTVGFASHASSLSTTSMTPYMRTQWPGNVQT